MSPTVRQGAEMRMCRQHRCATCCTHVYPKRDASGITNNLRITNMRTWNKNHIAKLTAVGAHLGVGQLVYAFSHKRNAMAR